MTATVVEHELFISEEDMPSIACDWHGNNSCLTPAGWIIQYEICSCCGIDSNRFFCTRHKDIMNGTVICYNCNGAYKEVVQITKI